MTTEREVLLMVHPDREATGEDAREVSARFAKAGNRIRVIEEDVCALINPEQPEWFAENGWKRVTAPALAAPEHPRWIDDFFGPLDPPRELVLQVVS